MRKLEHKSQDELKNMRRMSYIKMAAMVGIVIAVIAFGSIAWFTSNREVEGESVKMTGDDLPFELAVKGNQTRFESLFSKADALFKQGTPGTDDDDDESEFFKTDIEKEQIRMRFTGTSEDAVAEIEPGGCGVLQFYVIPTKSGDLSIDFDMNIRGYFDYTTTVNGEETTSLVDISALTTTNPYELTAQDVQDRKTALRYVNGHIFFFGNEGEPNSASSPYYYVEPLEDNTYHFEKENARKGKLYPVTLYWMWPNTIGQITLKNSAGGKRSGIPVVEDAEYTTTVEVDGVAKTVRTDKGIIVDMVKARNNVNGENWIFKTTDTITDTMIENSNVQANFTKLSTGYNEADRMIGTYVRYFMLEITGTPCN